MGKTQKALSELPYLAIVDSAVVLRLPPLMQAALDACQPTFRPWGLNDYELYVLTLYADAFSPRHWPSAVVGDFNGDGILDVAADGRTATDRILLVVLSTVGGYVVIELDTSPLTLWKNGITPGHLDGPTTRSDTFLGLVTARIIHPAIGDVINLAGDAIGVTYSDKASELWAYRNGQFEQLPVGD